MDYRTIYEGGTGEIVEKKSHFIAQVFPVESEEEAALHLGEVKKEYWDARHHCWAYIIGEEQVQERFSDDEQQASRFWMSSAAIAFIMSWSWSPVISAVRFWVPEALYGHIPSLPRPALPQAP